MALIYANGRLSRITSAAGPANYDEAATSGIDRWTGDVGVTVHARHSERIAGNIDQIDEAHLIVPYEVNGAPVGKLIVRGDTLTYADDDGVQVRTAGTIVRARMTGRVRVDLEAG
jgi:hypothetical protein